MKLPPLPRMKMPKLETGDYILLGGLALAAYGMVAGETFAGNIPGLGPVTFTKKTALSEYPAIVVTTGASTLEDIFRLTGKAPGTPW
jgi:hypothetical protein